jgi:delta 1-pyrroline-5-carboxylate dehydrogenase
MARLISGGGGGGGSSSGGTGTGIAGDVIAIGNVVALSPAGTIVLADPALPGELWRVAGVALQAKSPGDAVRFQLLGGSVPALFDVAPLAGDVGKMVFLGGLGVASLVAPAGAAQSRLGVLAASTGGTLAPVLLRIETVALDQ